MVVVKGYEINIPKIRDSHYRRAQRFKNVIIESLRPLGVIEEDVEIELERVPIKRVPAKITWWVDDFHLEYEYHGGNYVENLYVISRVITNEVQAVLDGTKTRDAFINDFEEAEDVEEQRKAAREHLGVSADASLEEINKAYKTAAKTAHPDAGGDIHAFKELNKAHKILRKQLGE